MEAFSQLSPIQYPYHSDSVMRLPIASIYLAYSGPTLYWRLSTNQRVCLFRLEVSKLKSILAWFLVTLMFHSRWAAPLPCPKKVPVAWLKCQWLLDIRCCLKSGWSHTTWSGMVVVSGMIILEIALAPFFWGDWPGPFLLSDDINDQADARVGIGRLLFVMHVLHAYLPVLITMIHILISTLLNQFFLCR